MLMRYGTINRQTQTDVATYWSRWAPFWDCMLHIVRLKFRFRKEGISALHLKEGMTVLDIGCGTGLNFPLLFEGVGKTGSIIAVDISSGMLERAKEQARKHRWPNFEFIQGDVSRMHLPKADAVAAFWCMISIQDYVGALKNIVSSLYDGGRLAVLDFKAMAGFPGLLVNPMFRQICRLSHQDVDREPWRKMQVVLSDVQKYEWKFGAFPLSSVYLAWGRKR